MRAIWVTSWKFPQLQQRNCSLKNLFWLTVMERPNKPSSPAQHCNYEVEMKKNSKTDKQFTVPQDTRYTLHTLHKWCITQLFHVLWYSIVMIIPHSNPKLNSIMTKNEYNNCLLYVCMHMGFSEKRTAEGITNI